MVSESAGLWARDKFTIRLKLLNRCRRGRGRCREAAALHGMLYGLDDPRPQARWRRIGPRKAGRSMGTGHQPTREHSASTAPPTLSSGELAAPPEAVPDIRHRSFDLC